MNLLRRATLILAIAAAPLAARAQVMIAEGPNNIAVERVARNAVDEPMLQINIENPIGGPAQELTAVTVTAAGSGDDVSDLLPGSLKIYLDADNDGVIDGADTLLGSGDYISDNGTFTLGGLSVPIPASVGTPSQINILVVCSFGPAAVTNETFQVRVIDNNHIQVRNASTQLPVAVTGGPVNGFARSIGAGRLILTRIVQTPDGAVAIPNKQLLPMFFFEAFAEDIEPISITSFDFLDVESADAVAGIIPGSVRIFDLDAQPANPTTGLIALGTFAANDGRVTLTPATPFVIARKAKNRFWVTIDLPSADTGVIGSKYRIQIPEQNAAAVFGGTSGDPIEIIGGGANGPSWEFNANPVTLASSRDLPASPVPFMPSTAQNYAAAAIEVVNDPIARNESCTISSFLVRARGTMNAATAVSSVRLFNDLGTVGKYDAASDVQLGSVTAYAPASGGPIAFFDFSGTPINLPVNGRANLLLVYNLNGTAVDGQTSWVEVTDNNDFQIVGNTSLIDSNLSPAPYTSTPRQVGAPRADLAILVNKDIWPPEVAPEGADFPLLGFSLHDRTDEDLVFKGIHFDFKGPLGEPFFFDSLELWTDLNVNGIKDGADAQLGADATLTLAGGDGKLDIVFPMEDWESIVKNATKNYTLYADIADDVVGDGTETFTIEGIDDAAFDLYGASSDAHATFASAKPPFSEAKTIVNPKITLTNYKRAAADYSICINGSYGMSGLSFVTQSSEDLVFTDIRFAVAGTLDAQQYVDLAYAWNDPNKDFLITGNEGLDDFDVPLTDTPWISTNNGEIPTEIPDEGRVMRNRTINISTGISLGESNEANALAQLGKTITMTQSGPMVLEGYGARSGRPIEVINAGGDDTTNLYTIDHGSVAITKGTIVRTVAVPSQRKAEVFSLRFATTILEGIELERLTLTALGTVQEQTEIDAMGMHLYVDLNRNGKIDGADYEVATADPPSTDNGKVSFFSTPQNPIILYSHSITPFDTLILAVDVKASAPEGTTLQFELESESDVDIKGACSFYDFVIGTDVTFPAAGTPPIVGPSILIQRNRLNIQNNATFVSQNSPTVVMAPTAQKYEVARLTVKADTDAEDIHLTGLTFHTDGTAQDVADLIPNGVNLYLNVVQDAAIIATGQFDADNGKIIFSGLNLTIKNNPPTTLSLGFSGSGSGAFGADFNLSISGSDIAAEGATSLFPVFELAPVDPFEAVPIVFGTGKLFVRGIDANVNALPIPIGGLDTIIQRLTFTASRTEPLFIEEVNARAAGLANELQALDSGAFFFQRHTNVVTRLASAPILDPASQPIDDGEARLRDLDILLPASGATSEYSIDGLLNPDGATAGTNLRADIESSTKVVAYGTLTGQAVPVVLEDFAGGDGILNAPKITGRLVNLTNGIVTISKGGKNPANAPVLGGEQNLVMMQLAVAVTNGLEGVNISEVRVCGLGSANEVTAISAIRLYQDVNADGLATAADVLLGSSVFVADNGQAAFTGLDLGYAQNSTTYWLFVADLAGTAVDGQNFQLGLCTPPTVTGLGQLTEGPINVVVNGAVNGGVFSMPAATPTPVPTASLTPTPNPNNSLFLSHGLPFSIGPNQELPFTMTWRNTGSTTWSPEGGYSLAVASGLAPCSLVSGTTVPMDPGTSVAPGAQYQFNGALIGGPVAGQCDMVFRLREPGGFFGQSFQFSVTVNQAPPAFTLNPASQIINEGQNVQFFAEAIDPNSPPAGTMTYQWVKNGTPVPGAVANSVTITGATNAESGQYALDATNGGGTTRSALAGLVVNSPAQPNQAGFLSHSLPTPIYTGQGLYVGFVMQNSSGLTWAQAQNYALAVTEDTFNLFQGVSRMGISDPQTVVPASLGVYTFIGFIQAPGSPGTYTAKLRMIQENVEYFGPEITLTVSVAIRPNATAAEWSAYE